MKKFFLFFALLVFGSACIAEAQQVEGGSPWYRPLSERIKISGFLQGGYTYTHVGGTNSNMFDIKRTIIIGRAQVTDRWSFFIMHDLSSQLQEFYTDYDLLGNKAMVVRFGQFKNQVSIENAIIPTALELVDVTSQGVAYLTGCGPDPMFGINYGRDLGVDLHGQLFGDHLWYDLCVMNGRGVNARDLNNKKDIIVKLDYRPIEGLRLVASAQKGYGTSQVPSSVYIPQENTIAPGADYQRDRWTVGAEWKSGANDYWEHRSTTLRGEVVAGKDGKTKSWGGYLTASVPLVDKLDLVASYDYFNYAKGYDKDRTMLLGGLQYWFYRRCRVQLQYSWMDTSTIGLNTAWLDHPAQRLQMQMQIAF